MKGVILSPAQRKKLVRCADSGITQNSDKPLDRTMLALESRDFVEWKFVGDDIVWTPTAAGLRFIGRNPAPITVEPF